MCCHSMGCRMGHYFLNFCLREKGREWIDRHIHTYMVRATLMRGRLPSLFVSGVVCFSGGSMKEPFATTGTILPIGWT